MPFDFERRRVSVQPDHADQRILVVKGSPEDILRVFAGYALGEALTALAASCVEVMVFNAKRSVAILEQPGPCPGRSGKFCPTMDLLDRDFCEPGSCLGIDQPAQPLVSTGATGQQQRAERDENPLH